MSGLDALITPTVPYFAPEKTPPIDSELGSYESLYTEIFNVSGQPAITLPTRCAQLPMGIQLVGSLGHDLDLLEIARRVEPLLL
jgi:aspartyl-tRNA(Asn)/glutamyl-tRNA(Gln) amidotransferase subunit A